MTYNELLKAASKRNQKRRNREFLETFVALVKKTVRKQGHFVLPGFLSFNVRTIKRRVILDPQTKLPLTLPATKTVKVKAAASWRSK